MKSNKVNGSTMGSVGSFRTPSLQDEFDDLFSKVLCIIAGIDMTVKDLVCSQIHEQYAHFISKRKLAYTKDLVTWVHLLHELGEIHSRNVIQLLNIALKLRNQEMVSAVREFNRRIFTEQHEEGICERCIPILYHSSQPNEVSSKGSVSLSTSFSSVPANSVFGSLSLPSPSSLSSVVHSHNSSSQDCLELISPEVKSHVADNIGRKWKDLARKLGIKESQIDQLEADYRFQRELAYQSMILFERNNPLMDPYTSRRKLLTALVEIRRKDLQEEVINLISQ